MKELVLISMLLNSLLTSNSLKAAVIEIGPGDDLAASISVMQSGDVLLLQSGDYLLTARFGVTLNCNLATPCKIMAKPGHSPHIQRAMADQNIMDLENSQFVTFEGIEFSGGSRGIRLSDSNHISFINNHIHDTGDAAITANDTGDSYGYLTFLKNHIHNTGGTGEGFYLGCNNNACQVHNSVIEGNYIHHTDGINVSQGDGIEIKEGSWGNVIKDNVIHNTKYPCILTYSTVGNGSANIIERNLLWECGDHAIQSTADAIIRNNIVLGAAVNGIHSQPHQSGTPDNLFISHNTILNANNNAININSMTGDILLANNALYAPNGFAIQANGTTTGLSVLNNMGEGGTSGIISGFDDSGDIDLDFINASYNGSIPQNVFPATGSLLIGSASANWNANDDFNFFSRAQSLDVGAYKYAVNGNPGWEPNNTHKPLDVIYADTFEY